MDTMSAFLRSEASRGSPLRVFDWEKAAQIIRERAAVHAEAGLSGDWEWTGGDILRTGIPVPAEETYTYLASTWATPALIVDGETVDCWRYQSDSPGWDSSTYWPESARAILDESHEPVANSNSVKE